MRLWSRWLLGSLSLVAFAWTSPAQPQSEGQPWPASIAQPTQIRSAPSPNAPVIESFDFTGYQIQVIGVAGDWYRVSIPHAGRPSIGFALKSAIYVPVGPTRPFNDADARAAAAAQSSGDWASAVRLWTAIDQAGDRSAEFDKADPSGGSPWRREIDNLGIAQAMLGVAYLKGTGAPRDLAISAAWYLKAHETFSKDPQPPGQNSGVSIMLGTFYAYGVGVTRDSQQAKALWARGMPSMEDQRLLIDYDALPPSIEDFLKPIDAQADYAAAMNAQRSGNDEQALRLFIRAAIIETGPASDDARMRASTALANGAGSAVDIESALLALNQWQGQQPAGADELREAFGKREYNIALAALGRHEYQVATRDFATASIFGGPKARAASGYELGVIERDGLGVARNDKTAAMYFADAGDYRAKVALLEMVHAGGYQDTAR